jgi:ATP-dependent DNA helicase RecG
MKPSKLEDENFDYKEKIDQSFGKIVCAYANTNGGKIVVGISKTGKIVGTTQKDEEKATNIMGTCKPTIKFRMKWEKRKNNDILIIDVPRSDRIHTWKGIAYKRSGSSSIPMDAQDIINLSKKRGDIRFDEEICKNATINDIDEEKVRQFLRKAKTERNYDVDPETPVTEVLDRLDLIKNGKIINAGVLLFAKKPERFFPQAKLKAARFKGTDSLDFIDMKVFKGTIPELREKAMNFILEHIRHGVFFDENRRYDKWEYPLRAVEEVLNNALAHRDYFSTGDIQISIYDDRIEIWNPGELPEPLKPKDLKGEHKSIPRNQLLADTLFLIRFIEEWGRGTNRIVDEMQENNLPDPTFKELSGGFEVVLMGPGKSFEDAIIKEKLHVLDINERQKKAIKYVNEKLSITRREYVEVNNVSSKTAYFELKDLVDKKIFISKGRGSSTRYLFVR